MQQNLTIYINVPHICIKDKDKLIATFISVQQRFENDSFHCSSEYVKL